MSNIASGIVLSPMATRIKLVPGEVYAGSLKVSNPVMAEEALHYTVHLISYGDLGIEGEVLKQVQDDGWVQDDGEEQDEGEVLKQVQDDGWVQDDGEGRHSELVSESMNSFYGRIVNWIEIDNPEGDLEPGEAKIINYTISVPEDAKNGGQYCAIAVRAGGENNTADAGVMIDDVFEIASVIYAQVGEVVSQGEVLEGSLPSYSLNNKVTGIVTVENTGNTHQDVQILTYVYSAFTGEQVYLGLTDEEKELLELGAVEEISSGADYYSEIIMPETMKTISHTIADMPVLGVYDIKQEVIFAGKVSFLNQQIIICPIWFIVLMILGMALSGLGIFKLISNIRKKLMQ